MDKIITYSFCENFNDNLVKYVKENYIDKGKDLTRLAIVSGGKRPELFVKQKLSKVIKKPFYPPKFFSIDEFIKYVVNKNCQFSNIGDLDNCFLLYEIARRVSPEILENRKSFSEFLPWTYEISGFIDQLDLENVDNKSLESIQANAQIGYDVPDDINRLLNTIIKVRKEYHKILSDEKILSRGLLYQYAAKNVKDLVLSEFDQILFCNFFYFNRCEEMVVKEFYEKGSATLIYQGDQRKWPVLNRISKSFDHEIKEGQTPLPPKFNLKLYSAFDSHSQVCMAREIIKGIKDVDKTVIVLPNPDNLIPLLSVLPDNVKNFNISMGYPLKRSSLYSLFEFIFKCQLSKKGNKYYTKDYLKVLRHPFVKNLNLSENSSLTRIIIHKIEDILTGEAKTDISGSLFLDLAEIIDLEELYSLIDETLKTSVVNVEKSELENIICLLHKILFEDWESISNFNEFSQSIEMFLKVLVDKSKMDNYPLNINIANKIHIIKDEFLNSSFNELEFEKSEMFKIFDSKISREIVAFRGSPLCGLQVLGLFVI